MGRPSQKMACTCVHCHKTFFLNPFEAKRGGKYCSRQCRTDAGHVDRTCEYCGKLFIATKTDIKYGRAKHCSFECRKLAKSTECTCECCGKRFTARRSASRKFCSQECYFKTDRKKYQECKCVICGITFIVREQHLKNKSHMGKYCSLQCAGIANSGESSLFWRGGHKDYRGANWFQQRKLAYERDGGICQICHRKPRKGERNFDIHHIRRYSEFNGDYIAANDLSNLITLCRKCHPKAEHGKIAVPVRLF